MHALQVATVPFPRLRPIMVVPAEGLIERQTPLAEYGANKLAHMQCPSSRYKKKLQPCGGGEGELGIL